MSSFVSYSDATQTFTYSPPIGQAPISDIFSVTLFDSGTYTYSWTVSVTSGGFAPPGLPPAGPPPPPPPPEPPSPLVIQITKSLGNLGPPSFLSPFPQLSLEVGATLTYTLPRVTDPDGDTYSVTFNLREASVFTHASSKSISFQPTFPGQFNISIKLTDHNGFPLSSTYELSLTVIAPQIEEAPPLQRAVATLRILKVHSDGTMTCFIDGGQEQTMRLNLSQQVSPDNTAVWLITGNSKKQLNFSVEANATESRIVLDLEYPERAYASRVSHYRFMHAVY